jgi:hypothetical protein
VLETLDPLPEDRKCFRMINGVLVERTVKDVKPALITNSEGLKQVLDELVVQYKSKQDDMEKWKVSTTLTARTFRTTNAYNRKRKRITSQLSNNKETSESASLNQI